MKIISVIIILSFMVSGCSSISSENTYGQFVTKEKHSAKSISSYVQWNNEYAVTVNHSEINKNVEYSSEVYDVKFVKHPSQQSPVWTDVNKGELLTMVGYPRLGQKQPTIRKGVDIGNVSTDYKNGCRGVKTLIVQGMSGGPVLNSNNEVVGINIGYSSEPVVLNNQTTELSLYLPYDVILKEWNKFKGIK